MAWTLLQTLLASLVVAQWYGQAAPLGALQEKDTSLEAHADSHIVSLGAPRSFSLFFPELPRSRDIQLTTPSTYKIPPIGNYQQKYQRQDKSPEKKISPQETTTVPVIEIPRKADKILENDESSNSFLDSFPEDLLSSNKKVKPVKVHIIEHDDYIDYEIEFIEIPDDMEFTSEEIVSDIHDYGIGSMKESNKLLTDVKPNGKDSKVTDTFLDLLEEARLRHKDKMLNEAEEKNKETHLETRKTQSKVGRRRNKIGQNPLRRNKTPRKIANKRPLAFSNYYASQDTTVETKKIMALREKLLTFRRSTTPSSLITTPSTIFATERSSTSEPFLRSTGSLVDDLSKLVIQTAKTTEAENEEAVITTQNSMEILHNDKTTITNTLVRNNELQGSLPTTYFTKDTTTMTTFPPTTPKLQVSSTENLVLTTLENEAHLNKHTTTEEIIAREAEPEATTISPDSPPTTTNASRFYPDIEGRLFSSTTVKEVTTEGSSESLTSTLGYQDDDLEVSESKVHVGLNFDKEEVTMFPEQPRGPSFESKPSSVNKVGATKLHLKMVDVDINKDKIDKSQSNGEVTMTKKDGEIDKARNANEEINTEKNEVTTNKLETTTEDGLYHEVNPGQYHEVNPGQYHEVNPGQYHEVNPGQYHEVNPGQYTEQPEDDIGVDNVTVDFNSGKEDDTKIYNVKANAGDFIIGEVGRIDVNSGQTLQGVRYTAVDGEVDQERISEILQSFFGARIN